MEKTVIAQPNMLQLGVYPTVGVEEFNIPTSTCCQIVKTKNHKIVEVVKHETKAFHLLKVIKKLIMFQKVYLISKQEEKQMAYMSFFYAIEED